MKAIKGTVSYNAKISRMVRQMPWRTIEETQLTFSGLCLRFYCDSNPHWKRNSTFLLTFLVIFQHLSESFQQLHSWFWLTWGPGKIAQIHPAGGDNFWCCSTLPGFTAVEKGLLFLWETIKINHLNHPLLFKATPCQCWKTNMNMQCKR